MDFKQIQELIKLINNSNIGEVTIEQKDLKLTIRQKEEASAVQMVAAPPAQAVSYAPPRQQAAPAASAATDAPAASTEAPAAATNTVTIKSPMIGTFYKRPAPDKPDFVAPGDEISVGKVVCIIEAMKLFNEIESGDIRQDCKSAGGRCFTGRVRPAAVSGRAKLNRNQRFNTLLFQWFSFYRIRILG